MQWNMVYNYLFYEFFFVESAFTIPSVGPYELCLASLWRGG